MGARVLLLVWLCGMLGASRGGASSAEFRQSLFSRTHESLSRQFIVHDPPVTDTYPPENNFGANLVKLDPGLLAVSCERIKKAFNSRLHQSDSWRGKIIIFLHHPRTSDESIVVRPTLFEGNWIYTVEMPDVINRTRLISSVVELIILEQANRGSDHCVEIPAWLSKGMSRELISSTSEQLVLESPHGFENGISLGRVSRTGNANQFLMDMHKTFQNVTPLGVEQLSWPGTDAANDPEGDSYQASAHLFTYELLQLPDGVAELKSFIGELPHYLNWQVAFLKAFSNHFATTRDLDKWWDLCLVRFTSRDIGQAWPSTVSRTRLQEIIHPDIEVRMAPNQLPMRSKISLQSMIEGWDVSKQLPVFHQKSRELLSLRVSSARDVAPLVEAYRNEIDNYLAKRENLAVVSMGKMPINPRLDDVARETIERFNRLDAQLNRAESSNNSVTTKGVGFPAVR